MDAPVLQVRNLTTRFQFGKKIYTVVDDLCLDLYKGKTLALVGESGCGKTITALSLLKILPNPPALAPEGEVIYQGQNLLQFSESKLRQIRGSKIAMIFQDPSSSLNPVYTIGNQLEEVLDIHMRLSGARAAEKIRQALVEVGINNPDVCMEAYPHQLSGGMKQRAMIAMALLCEPDILIADEPTTALDVTIQAQVLHLMRTLQKKKQMAILLITHDMGVVAEMADEVIVMYATQKIEEGRCRQVLQATGHPYTQGLLHSLPASGSPKTYLPTIKGTVPPITDLPSGCYFHPRCPYAMEICKHGKVPYFPGKESSQQVKCWLFDASAHT